MGTSVQKTVRPGRMETLLERGDELAAIERLLAGGGGALVIEGRAGIGKTSLLEVATQRAKALEWDVLSARGSELEQEFAFGVVYQLFERRITSANQTERDLFFAGAARGARALFSGQPQERTV